MSCQPRGEDIKPCTTVKRCGLDECFAKAPPPPKIIYLPVSNKGCCKCKPKKKCLPKCKPCCPSKKCCPCCSNEQKKICKSTCKTLNSNFACKVETMGSKLRITIYKPSNTTDCKPICSSPQLEVRDCRADACESDSTVCKSKKKKKKKRKKCCCSICQSQKTSPYESTSTVCKCKKQKRNTNVSKSRCTCLKRVPISHESAPSICRTKKKKRSIQVSKSACNCTKNDVSTCESLTKVCKPIKKKRSNIPGSCSGYKTPLMTEVFKTMNNAKCLKSSSSSEIGRVDVCEPSILRCLKLKKPREITKYPIKKNNFKCKNKFTEASLWTVFQ
ncbi:keratin-associated protein 10-11-like [Diorhabda sublineata]|uniref:keratin-associated protein 10-11-like n=1 Tax=Diorhabda sublineata TaxID=1163346 RepID=UPI0024E19157|nr:keratin-associated protein 10-11-like [Diorhabda sublineata]